MRRVMLWTMLTAAGCVCGGGVAVAATPTTTLTTSAPWLAPASTSPAAAPTRGTPAAATTPATATASASPRGDLPYTGDDLLPESLAAGGLIAAGLLLRIRRRPA